MGLASKDAWYTAMNEAGLARIELCTAMADFSKEANHFNQLTGGWVSKTFNWNKGAYDVLFRAAIPEEKETEEDSGEDFPQEEPPSPVNDPGLPD